MSKFEFEFGPYKGRIKSIGAKQAFPPWYPMDRLVVMIEFDEPYPESVVSMGIGIPAREYNRRELIDVIKKEGSRQVMAMVSREADEKTATELERQKQEKLKTLADRAMQLLKT
jgi:hypothetical protein